MNPDKILYLKAQDDWRDGVLFNLDGENGRFTGLPSR